VNRRLAGRLPVRRDQLGEKERGKRKKKKRKKEIRPPFTFNITNNSLTTLPTHLHRCRVADQREKKGKRVKREGKEKKVVCAGLHT